VDYVSIISEPTGSELQYLSDKIKNGKVKVYPCTGTEALYRPYGP